MTAPKITTLDNWHVRAPKAPASAHDQRIEIISERGTLVATMALGPSIERDKALASLVAQTPRMLRLLRNLAKSAIADTVTDDARAILASAGL